MESPSFQVRRTGMTSSIFCPIGLYAMELFALSTEIFSYRFVMEKMSP